MFDKFLENCQTHFLDRPAEWLFQFVSLCATKSACIHADGVTQTVRELPKVLPGDSGTYKHTYVRVYILVKREISTDRFWRRLLCFNMLPQSDIRLLFVCCTAHPKQSAKTTIRMLSPCKMSKKTRGKGRLAFKSKPLILSCAPLCVGVFHICVQFFAAVASESCFGITGPG